MLEQGMGIESSSHMLLSYALLKIGRPESIYCTTACVPWLIYQVGV